MKTCDVAIVGAGFAGLVAAERLSNTLGLHCIVIERRAHVGGNAYDEVDAAGVLVHRYGPHYFRTNADRIRTYLSQFTEWHPADYKVLSYTDGRFWRFPINLNTFEQMVGRPSSAGEMEAYLAAHRVSIDKPVNSEEVVVSQVGWELYERFFKNYTIKQWGRHPRDLDASVCGRIPVRTNRDDRYLKESFQALPRDGYTAMFKRMLAASPRVEVLLGVDYRQVLPEIQCRHVIYTGSIDEFFDYADGPLPYRSLRFEPESFSAAELEPRRGISGKPGFWQPALQVNYPNDEAFTRIVEIKHATGQMIENTTIVREYPEAHGPGKEPYYPVPAPDAAAKYARYQARAVGMANTSFIGRLATYRYLNMDQVVGMALTEVDRLRAKFLETVAGP